MKPIALIAIVAPVLLASPILAAPTAPVPVAAASQPTSIDVAKRTDKNHPGLQPISTQTPADLPQASPTSTSWDAEEAILENLEARHAHGSDVDHYPYVTPSPWAPTRPVHHAQPTEVNNIDAWLAGCVAEYRFRSAVTKHKKTHSHTASEPTTSVYNPRESIGRTHSPQIWTPGYIHCLLLHRRARSGHVSPFERSAPENIEVSADEQLYVDSIKQIKPTSEDEIIKQLKPNPEENDSSLSQVADLAERTEAVSGPWTVDSPFQKPHETIDTQLERCVRESMCSPFLLDLYKACEHAEGYGGCRSELMPKIRLELKECKAKGLCRSPPKSDNGPFEKCNRIIHSIEHCNAYFGCDKELMTALAKSWAKYNCSLIPAHPPSYVVHNHSIPTANKVEKRDTESKLKSACVGDACTESSMIDTEPHLLGNNLQERSTEAKLESKSTSENEQPRAGSQDDRIPDWPYPLCSGLDCIHEHQPHIPFCRGINGACDAKPEPYKICPGLHCN